MDKILYTGDQPDMLSQLDGMWMRMFETGRHVKQASSDVFSEKLMAAHVPDDRHYGVHLIAMGSGENYGFNKNGDWWTRDGLVRRHRTFETNGHYFREHRNTDPKLKIGDIKAAAFHPKMDRVELIIWGDKEKSASEYAAAKSGKQLSFSMSARVPWDECSICGHKAKRSSEYCTHLRNNMTRWISKFSKFAYAVNHDPTFFDISKVANPADRIAHHLQYLFSPDDELAKAASANAYSDDFVFSDEQAELFGVDLSKYASGFADPGRQAILAKLAGMEAEIQEILNTGTGDPVKKAAVDNVLGFANFDTLEDQDVIEMRKMEPDVLFYKLAKSATCLPFPAFYAYVTGIPLSQVDQDSVFKEASAHFLSRTFRDALESNTVCQLEQDFDASDSIKAACMSSDPIEKLMSRVSDRHSVHKPKVTARVLRVCISNPSPMLPCQMKEASDASVETRYKARAFVEAYAAYKVAFVKAAQDLAVENAIDDLALLLVSSNL